MIQITAGDPPIIESRLWAGLKGDIAFYVGANCGQHFSKLISAGFTRVYAFEPCDSSYEIARLAAQGLTTTGPASIDVLPMAVSSYDGTLDLAMLTGTRQEETGQLVTPGHRGMEWEPQDWSDRSAVKLVPVQCRTLDTLVSAFGSPDLVTIDTEGHEFSVLNGSGRLLTEDPPAWWLIEFHSPENQDNCRRALEGHGYEVETIRHPHYQRFSHMWYQHGWLKARHI